MFYGTLPPDTQDFRQVLAGIARTIRDRAAAAGQRIGQSGSEAIVLQNQIFGDPNRPLRVTDENALRRYTEMIMAGPMGFAPMGMTSAIGKKAVQESMSLPHNIEDVTTIPIPSKFGGVNTEEYLFHGGIKGKLDPMSKRRNLQGAEAVDDIVPTSFSKSPQEALEYTTVSGGDIVAIPKSSVKIYEGGNKKLDEAFMSNNIKALKDAGYDGVDTRSIYPGGYREVVIWNLDKAAKKALYAPVSSTPTETYIREKLRSLLD